MTWEEGWTPNLDIIHKLYIIQLPTVSFRQEGWHKERAVQGERTKITEMLQVR